MDLSPHRRTSRLQVATRRRIPQTGADTATRTPEPQVRQELRRTTALHHDRNNVIVVASALGQAENPQWYRNLPPNPDTHIQIGSDRRPVRAVVTSSDERARLWPRPVDAYADFDSCQSWTERGIPVIILRPR